MHVTQTATSLIRNIRSRYQLDTTTDQPHNVILIVLGEFEYLLLSATARLGDDAYGAAIRTEIEAVTGRACSIGALYTTLDRLEKKGLISTRMGDPTPQRGGRPKRMVRITAAGKREAARFYATVRGITRGAAWDFSRTAISQ